VRVEAHTVTVTNGAQIQSGTFGRGKGGDLTVMAQGAVSVDGFGGGLLSLITANSDMGAIGDAGSVRVKARTVTATNGAQISSVTFGAGQGGSVRVKARGSVTFTGTSPEGETLLGVLIPGDRTFPSGAVVNSHGAGAPGIVRVTAPRVTLAEGGRISSLNIASAAAGGTVIVRAAETLAISGAGSGLRTSSFGPGPGGDIAVTAGTITLTDGAGFSAESITRGDAAGSGNAGNVQVTVRQSLLIENSSVTTEATQADGGNITVRAQTMVRLRNSQMTATVRGGPQTRGGNITIDPEFVILENSAIIANAVEGRGGNIQITAQEAFLADPTSRVDATALAEVGIDGTVDIRAPVTNVSGTFAPLPQRFGRELALLGGLCAQRLRGGERSSFVLARRDGLPLEPGMLLPSPLVNVSPAEVESRREQQRPSVTQVGLLRVDDHGTLHIRGAQGQSPFLGGLDGPCAPWGGR
jgi:large exoprotein involved in heme utilization and adhesion